MDYFIKNEDGTYTLVTNKLIPEQELIDFKATTGNKATESESKIASLTDDLQKMTVRATESENKVTALTTELEPLKVEAAKVPELTTQVQTLTSEKANAETQLLSTKRSSILEKYGITDTEKKTAIEAMDAQALANFESALTLAGIKPGNKDYNGNGFDGGNSKGKDTSSMSGQDKMRAGLDAGLLATGSKAE